MKALVLVAAVLATGAAHPGNDDPAFIAPGDIPHANGEQIFTHICQGCHMPGATGAIGAGHYPALAANPKLASAAYPAVMVINGRGDMPAFGDYLTDTQVADVVNYVRSHFGNAYADTLTPDDIKPFRPPPAPAEDH